MKTAMRKDHCTGGWGETYEDKNTADKKCSSETAPIAPPTLAGVAVPDVGITSVHAEEEVQVHDGEEHEGDSLENQTDEEDLHNGKCV